MKTIVLFFFLLISSLTLRSQDIALFGDNQASGHMVTLKVGADFGTVYGLSYGYKFSGKQPVMVGTELTTPFGGKIMDDFKARLTAQTIFWPAKHLGIAIKPGMAFRRNGTEAAVVCNISTELATSVGYYRNKWSIATETVFDYSNATLLKHRKLQEYYPEIKDEWYKNTGGTIKFGVQGTYWLRSTGVSVKAGKVYGRNFKNNPTIPFYADFSVLRKW